MQTDALVYAQCLKVTEERIISKEVLNRFETCCNIIIKNNQLASFEELCESCGVILKLMLESPDTNLSVMKLIISW